MNAIEDRKKEAGNGWIHTSSFEEYTSGMLHATPYAASTRWGGDHENFLYTRIYLQYVVVYHEVEGTYKRLFDYAFQGLTSISSDNVHLLLLHVDHYKFLTLNTTNNKRKNRRKKRNRISALATIKHKLVGDIHSIVPCAEDEDPAAPKETACAYPPATLDKTLTQARVRSKKKLKIEIRYDPDPKSLNHYFPRVTRSETKKESIVADNDCDDPGASEENASNPTDDIGDKDITQLKIHSQTKSNINLFHYLYPESSFVITVQCLIEPRRGNNPLLLTVKMMTLVPLRILFLLQLILLPTRF